LNPAARRRSLPALRVLAAALCLGVLCSAPGLKAQTESQAASATAAQPFDATNLRQPTTLGAIWLVKAGDDPAYARPEFDDSQWARVDPSADVKTIFPNSYPEVLWYRLHVKVAPTQSGLGLAERSLSSAFEIFVNGQRIMQTGRVAPFVPYTQDARLLAPIPDAQVATGSLVIALRVHLLRSEWDSKHPGLYTTNLTLGMQHAMWEHIWIVEIGREALNSITVLSGLGLGFVALALFAAQRRQWEYLWIFLQFFFAACALSLALIADFYNVPVGWTWLPQPFRILSAFFTVLGYFAILRMRFGWRMRALLAIAIIGFTLSWIGLAHLGISQNAGLIAILPFLFLIAGVIPVLVVVQMRRGNREAGILLVPLILTSLAIYAEILLTFLGQFPVLQGGATRASNLIFNIKAGPFAVGLEWLGELLYVLSLAIIIVLRSTRISRQQAVLEGEVAAAREIQQVLLPEQVEYVPGFTVESVYQPAQQVGGDFFQILPDGNGGMLVVVGDVAGKGLPAAMLVSVLVGAIRGVAEYTKDPAELLANLNERLVGRGGGGFSTALVAGISAAGSVTVANAGHLSPYLDGREVELPGALPLGVMSGAVYETTQFVLAQGSRLTFYSDGVVEAQNQKGELFGFERARELSMQPAAAIVEAAKQFGQEDDITVVTIERNMPIAAVA
jgi:sigma-B regulation protein RsbU (phosphoserine phosphatase)